jgi:hypothetical protein
MWEPWHLTILWTSMAYYKDSFTFTLHIIFSEDPVIHCTSAGALYQKCWWRNSETSMWRSMLSSSVQHKAILTPFQRLANAMALGILCMTLPEWTIILHLEVIIVTKNHSVPTGVLEWNVILAVHCVSQVYSWGCYIQHERDEGVSSSICRIQFTWSVLRYRRSKTVLPCVSVWTLGFDW